MLSTSSGQSVTQIEDFLGLSRGLLNSFSSDQDTSDQFLDASGLKRDISVEAGQQLEFDWKFLAGDELPFNDTFFTVAGSDIFSVASVYSVGDYGEDQGTFTYVLLNLVVIPLVQQLWMASIQVVIVIWLLIISS